jgi:hypothetical protein
MTSRKSYQKRYGAERPLSGFVTPDLYVILKRIDEIRARNPHAQDGELRIRIVQSDGFRLWWTCDSLEFLICDELSARNAPLPPRRELVPTSPPTGRPYLRLIRQDSSMQPGTDGAA